MYRDKEMRMGAGGMNSRTERYTERTKERKE